jgi:hypothetical protein
VAELDADVVAEDFDQWHARCAKHGDAVFFPDKLSLRIRNLTLSGFVASAAVIAVAKVRFGQTGQMQRRQSAGLRPRSNNRNGARVALA